MRKPAPPPLPAAKMLSEQKTDFTAEGSPPPGKVSTGQPVAAPEPAITVPAPTLNPPRPAAAPPGPAITVPAPAPVDPLVRRPPTPQPGRR